MATNTAPPTPAAVEATDELAALVKTLLDTSRRLEELTAGEVDAVADSQGQTFLLQRAQDQLRHSEAAKQAAILNALPAHIALLDAHGVIVSVNDTWSNFSRGDVGLDYLAICDDASGNEAAGISTGIRSVLAGTAKSFSVEYASKHAGETRWYLLTATPLGSDGAVLMHLDVTARTQAALELIESERRFSDMLGNVEMISIMLDREARLTYCNDYLLRLTGWRREDVMGRDWLAIFLPPGAAGMSDVFDRLIGDQPEARHHENEIVTRTGERRMIRWNNSVLRSAAGEVVGTASIGEDITERRLADQVLAKRAADLERFHRLSVGREMQMIELKKEVNALALKAGEPPPYALAFLKTPLPTAAISALAHIPQPESGIA